MTRLNDLLIQAAKKYGYSYTLSEKGIFILHIGNRSSKGRASREVRND